MCIRAAYAHMRARNNGRVAMRTGRTGDLWHVSNWAATMGATEEVHQSVSPR